MRRREFIVGIGGAVAWPLVASAQQRTLPIIGLLDATPSGSNAEPLRAFHQGLKETGYVETSLLLRADEVIE